MRAIVAPILFHLLVLAAGMGLLRLGGTVPRLWSMRALAAGGLAYLCGLGAVMSLSILLLVLGGPFNLVTLLVICVVLASPLLLDLRGVASDRRRRPAWLTDPRGYWREAGLERRTVILTMSAFALIAVIGIFTLSGQPIDREAGFDTWNLWMRKASLLFFDSHLPLAVLKSHAEGYIQAYYPLGYSLLLAAHMRAMGVYETSTVHVVVWVLLVALVWAGAFLGSRVTRPVVWAALLPGAVFLVYGQASSGYADVPVAIFLGLGVLATGVWLESGRRGDLPVACLLLAGAAQIKNEGFSGAIVVLVAAACYVLLARRSLLRGFALAAAALVAVAILPWRLWLYANHIPGDHSLSETFNPVYLIDHFNRVWPSLKALEAQITGQSTTCVFIVIALALALWRLRGRSRHPLSGFYLAVGFLYFLSLLTAYWTSPFGYTGLLSFYIPTSIFRIVPGGLGFICIAAIVHLSSIEADPPPGAARAIAAEPGDSLPASPQPQLSS
jgi:hypothetical protein